MRVQELRRNPSALAALAGQSCAGADTTAFVLAPTVIPS